MRRRTLIAALAVAGALAAGGTALAGTTPPPAQSPACERALERLEDLQARAVELGADIAQIRERLGSGELNARQERKAEQRLAKLEERLGNVAERIERVEAKIANRCTDEPTDPPDDPPGPTE